MHIEPDQQVVMGAPALTGDSTAQVAINQSRRTSRPRRTKAAGEVQALKASQHMLEVAQRKLKEAQRGVQEDLNDVTSRVESLWHHSGLKESSLKQFAPDESSDDEKSSGYVSPGSSLSSSSSSSELQESRQRESQLAHQTSMEQRQLKHERYLDDFAHAREHTYDGYPECFRNSRNFLQLRDEIANGAVDWNAKEVLENANLAYRTRGTPLEAKKARNAALSISQDRALIYTMGRDLNHCARRLISSRLSADSIAVGEDPLILSNNTSGSIASDMKTMAEFIFAATDRIRSSVMHLHLVSPLVTDTPHTDADDMAETMVALNKLLDTMSVLVLDIGDFATFGSHPEGGVAVKDLLNTPFYQVFPEYSRERTHSKFGGSKQIERFMESDKTYNPAMAEYIVATLDRLCQVLGSLADRAMMHFGGRLDDNIVKHYSTREHIPSVNAMRVQAIQIGNVLRHAAGYRELRSTRPPFVLK